jgi:adenine deaminase
LPGIELAHERIALTPGADWPATLAAHDLCHVAVIERHGRSGGIAHGLLSAFGLKRGAVASSVGHDSHNLIVAGRNEADMRVALDAIAAGQGGVCVVEEGQVVAMVPLPVAGLLSDKRVGAVAEEVRTLKRAWDRAGCSIPYMGFNLIPLSVIPQIRITDKGLVLVPEMRQVPLFEAA